MAYSDITFDSDRAVSICGVEGRLTHRTVKPGQAVGLWFKQRWTSFKRPIKGYGKDAALSVEIRFDDELGNRHNSFAITAEVRRPGARDCEACGCLHDEIKAVFPELAHLIKWHLVATDGPMHYLANTTYLAGDLDHRGLAKGERRQIKDGKTGAPSWELVAIIDGKELPLHQAARYVDSETEPVAPNVKYVPWCNVGEGKERELDAARRTAVWPEATDAQLSAPRAELAAALTARLPALIAAFRADMEAIGFYWSPEDFKAKNEVQS